MNFLPLVFLSIFFSQQMMAQQAYYNTRSIEMNHREKPQNEVPLTTKSESSFALYQRESLSFYVLPQEEAEATKKYKEILKQNEQERAEMNPLSKRGNDKGNGGDVNESRQQVIKSWIEKSLRKTLLVLVESLNPSIISGDVGHQYRQIISRLVQDLNKTNIYEITTAELYNKNGKNVFALPTADGRILFSLKSLTDQLVTYQRLVEICLHAHALSYPEIDDEQDQFGPQILKSYLSEYPTMNKSGQLVPGITPSIAEVRDRNLTSSEAFVLNLFYTSYQSKSGVLGRIPVLEKEVTEKQFRLEVLKGSSLRVLFETFDQDFDYRPLRVPAYGHIKANQLVEALWNSHLEVSIDVKDKLKDGNQSVLKIMQLIINENREKLNALIFQKQERPK